MVSPGHPTTTCVSTLTTAPRIHFSTRQCSASLGKCAARLSPHCYYPSLACPQTQREREISLQHRISGIIWDGELVIPGVWSLKELETRLQQIRNKMPQDITQNLYVSMPDCITLYIRARGGSTGY
ncbi:UNVERIFIED_CONTAM: hypothetical protein NCL1_22756 [Trichonephila clavipes]